MPDPEITVQGDVIRISGRDILDQTTGCIQTNTDVPGSRTKPASYADHFSKDEEGVPTFPATFTPIPAASMTPSQ